MYLFTSELRAIDPTDGELKLWQGPNIPAISLSMAESFCQQNGLGYLTITGILVKEIEVDSNLNKLKETDFNHRDN